MFSLIIQKLCAIFHLFLQVIIEKNKILLLLTEYEEFNPRLVGVGRLIDRKNVNTVSGFIEIFIKVAMTFDEPRRFWKGYLLGMCVTT